jgi:hypothetical protein
MLLAGIINVYSPRTSQFKLLADQIQRKSQLKIWNHHSETHAKVKALMDDLVKALHPELERDL